MAISTAEDFRRLNGEFEHTLSCGLTVKIKPLSTFMMLTDGSIPNELLIDAVKLFAPSRFAKPAEEKEKTEQEIADDEVSTTRMIVKTVKNVLVQPRYDDIKNYLDDTMAIEIYVAARKGKGGGMSKAAKSDTLPGDTNSDTHGEDVELQTVTAA